MASGNSSTDELIVKASVGDAIAVRELLEKHRPRLRRMVSVRMDERLAARVDPSDVVQETMLEASCRFAGYLKAPPLPFYPWLRQIAVERLEKLYRRHIVAQKRSVNRELPNFLPVNDRSSLLLARQFVARGTSPSGRLQREESRQHMIAALESLDSKDREVIVLRHLEQLSVSEVASVLGLSEAAAKSRHFRAIHRLQEVLGNHT